MPSQLPLSKAADILERYDAFLLDAYGVLVTSQGALQHAPEFLRALRQRNKHVFVASNDASRLPQSIIEKMRSRGLEFSLPEILSAGQMLIPYFNKFDLHHQRCFVLGTPESHALVEQAGGHLIASKNLAQMQVLVICDDSGFEWKEILGQLITVIAKLIQSGHPPRLVLANPDLVYPSGPDCFSLTAGSLAGMIKGALESILPGVQIHFDVLGKPSPWIFSAAKTLVGETTKIIMLGDQLATDIAGANEAKISSGLLLTGISRHPTQPVPNALLPRYVLADLSL